MRAADGPATNALFRCRAWFITTVIVRADRAVPCLSASSSLCYSRCTPILALCKCLFARGFSWRVPLVHLILSHWKIPSGGITFCALRSMAARALHRPAHSSPARVRPPWLPSVLQLPPSAISVSCRSSAAPKTPQLHHPCCAGFGVCSD